MDGLLNESMNEEGLIHDPPGRLFGRPARLGRQEPPERLLGTILERFFNLPDV